MNDQSPDHHPIDFLNRYLDLTSKGGRLLSTLLRIVLAGAHFRVRLFQCKIPKRPKKEVMKTVTLPNKNIKK